MEGRNTVNGTMLYRNGHNLAQNYAASPGDNTITEGGTRVNAGRDSDCRSSSYTTDQIYNNNAALNNAIITDYQSSYEFNDELRTCLKLDEIDEDFNVSLAERTNDTIWSINFTDLETSVLQLFPRLACVKLFVVDLR